MSQAMFVNNITVKRSVSGSDTVVFAGSEALFQTSETFVTNCNNCNVIVCDTVTKFVTFCDMSQVMFVNKITVKRSVSDSDSFRRTFI